MNPPFEDQTGGAIDDRLGGKSLRVIDLGNLVAGPFAATLLGDFGHEIIKVERPGLGDLLRYSGSGQPGMSDYWLLEGRNKRAVTLDWRTPRGRELLLELISISDVLIENYRPGVLSAAGLAYEDVAALHPHIIYVSVSGFGASGPRSKDPSVDQIAAAFGGLSAVTGVPGDPPLRPGLLVADYLSGVFGAFAILQAVWRRAAGDGTGDWIDLALYESLIRISETSFAEYSRTGAPRVSNGGLSRGSVPSGIYLTSDGQYVCIAAPSPKTFGSLAGVMEDDVMLDYAKYPTNVERLGDQDRIESLVRGWVAEQNYDELQASLRAAGVPFARVNNTADIVHEPHVVERENLVRAEAPDGVDVLLPGVVPRLYRSPGKVRWYGQGLGESNDVVYGELLSLSAAEIGELSATGVI